MFAWTLMDDHWHAFLRVAQGDLSPGMHDLNAGYASAFSRPHGRRGPVSQGRFRVKAACDAFGAFGDYVLRRGSRRNRARLAGIYLCRFRTGASAPEIGGHFGGMKGQAISNLVRKSGTERLWDKELDLRLSAMEETLSQNG